MTARQRAVHEVVQKQNTFGVCPTARSVASSLGISTEAARGQLNALARKGLVGPRHWLVWECRTNRAPMPKPRGGA
jgi:predicted ArsR family transcriptional regulator